MLEDSRQHRTEREPHLHTDPFQPEATEKKATKPLRPRRDTTCEVDPHHAVFNEPHLAADYSPTAGPISFDWRCEQCGFNLRGQEVGRRCPECGHVQRAAPPPLDRPCYASWLTERMAVTSKHHSWTAVWIVAALGGPWAIIGAVLASYGPLAIVVFGPLAEEVMKVALVAVLIETRAYLFKKEDQIRIAAIGSALVFAAIENTLYLTVYSSGASWFLTLWRWTICTSLHAGCTAIAVSGLVRVWQRATWTLQRPDLNPAFRTVTIAAIVHGAYNFAMVLLQLSGFDF